MFYFRNDLKHNMTFYEPVTESQYFELRKREGLIKIDKSFNLTLYLIRNYKKYRIDNFNFWEKSNVTFFIETPFQYDEAYFFIILDVLADVKNLFLLEQFSFNNYEIFV